MVGPSSSQSESQVSVYENQQFGNLPNVCTDVRTRLLQAGVTVEYHHGVWGERWAIGVYDPLNHFGPGADTYEAFLGGLIDRILHSLGEAVLVRNLSVSRTQDIVHISWFRQVA